MSERTLNARIVRQMQNNDSFVAQDLIATTANIVGTSYKGKAFVPHMILPDNLDVGTPVYNTLDKTIGTDRQNRYQHLYDNYSCNIESDAYDAISVWIDNGGEQASYTRVLGIGTGVKDEDTGKMVGSGFNASNNISSGTLNHQRGPNLNAVAGGVEGNVSFVFKTINEISKGLNDVDNADVTKVDYLDEIFTGKDNDELSAVNILTDVMIFPSGVLPSLRSTLPETFTPAVSSYESAQSLLLVINASNSFIVLDGFDPNIDLPNDTSEDNTQINNSPSSFIQDSLLDSSNFINKQEIYTNSFKNYFSDRFLDRGHLTYATFSFGGINDNNTGQNSFILTAAPYEYAIEELEGSEKEVPDYNSFESEFSTAKTPWITSQPLNRIDLENNRVDIHNKVQNLFRFWSLDDGDIGNKYRIKINPTKRGTPEIETFFDDITAGDFATFDIYVFVYDPRDNSYTEVDSYKDVNLHPDSSKYIARVIGNTNEYFDFNANKVVKIGEFPNKSQFIRVEVDDAIKNKTFKNQHQILPSGFRSYPHIKFEKNAFKRWSEQSDKINIEEVFTSGVYQLPPLYALNVYEEYETTTPLVEDITNHWGVVFNRSKVENNELKRNNDDIISREVSPHFYYTKYFLNGIVGEKSYKNIWIEEDNYLNSFFHLEKILVSNTSLNKYKHSGRTPSNTETHSYLNLDNDDLWEDNREFKTEYKNKLSFDFFTYGGFDGVDIRDNDKKNLRNDAIIREFHDENEVKCTYSAYDKAIDIAMDESNCSGDILVVPGIRELPIVRKCIQKCEEDRRHFYIADMSGAASNNMITFNDTRKLSNEPPEPPIPVISSLGVMGNKFRVLNDLSNYELDLVKTTATDTRFQLTGKDKPNRGDIDTFYKYSDVLEQQYPTIRTHWANESIRSRYLFAVYGDLTTDTKQVCSEVFVLAKMAQSGSPTIDISNDIEVFVRDFKSSLILNSRLAEGSETFNSELKDFRRSSANVIFLDDNSSPIKLKTQITAYDIRKSVFQEQKFVRSIQEIKKRIKFDIFRNDSLVQGGFLFAQNSNFQNLYQKLEIQLNTIMSQFLEEGLIINYKVNVNKQEDDKIILDMQNYIIRGNIVLQFKTSDIIKLELDEILSDLSLLANPGQDTVYIPSI